MKILLTFLLLATLMSAQRHATPVRPAHPLPDTAKADSPQGMPSDMNALWQAELPNMKSDLAELRAMLNVMASQEMSLDTRSSGAFQTNRQMWQVVIARLAELTQRMDALEHSQGHQAPPPKTGQP